jgi:hypothetical protein
VGGIAVVASEGKPVSGVGESVVTSEPNVVGHGGNGVVEHGRVVDQRSGSGKDLGVSIEDGGISGPLLPLGVSLSKESKVGSLGSSNLGGVHNGLGGDSSVDRGDQRLGVEGGGNQRLGVEGRGDQRFGVEGRGDSSVDGSDGQTGVSHTETSGISDVFDLLENSVGVHIRVTTSHSSVGVSDLVLGGVDVGEPILEVTELILGMVLAPSRVGGIGGHRGHSMRGIGSHWGSQAMVAIGESMLGCES